MDTLPSCLKLTFVGLLLFHFTTSQTLSPDDNSTLNITTVPELENVTTTLQTLSTELQEVRPKTVEERWKDLEVGTKKIASSIVKGIIRAVLTGQESGRSNVSAVCLNQMMKVLAGMKEIRPWALSFLDASGKIIDGLLMGTMSSLGEFDQCLDIEATEDRRGKNYGKVLFRGQYCAVDIKPPLPPKPGFYKLHDTLEELKNFSKGKTITADTAKVAHLFYMMSIRHGLCVPSGCQKSDLEQLTNRLAERSGLSISVRRCEVKKDKEYTNAMIAIMCVSSFLGLLMLIGTILDVYSYCTNRPLESLPNQILLAFSFVTNFKKLVNTDVTPGPFNCFHGMRVLSITWIILGHTYLNINFQLFRGLRNALEMPKDFAFQALVNATVAVDTFFFMGGALVCYLSVKLVRETKRPFNIGLYLFHRVYRIMPIYSIVVAAMFLAPLFGNGPVWHETVDYYTESCQKNWWANLLFINNFYDTLNMCLPQSWYIACDMQLYIAALIVLLPLFRWPKIGITIAFLAVVASMIASGTITYIMNYPPTMLFVHADIEQRLAYWASLYFKPYSHAGPYCVGMLIGYLLVTKPKLRFSLPTRIIGWSLAIACNISVLYGVWEWNKGNEPTQTETIFYSTCHRVAWSLGVAWVVINCATGQGGVINYILTWKAWTALSRMTYGAYLIHPLVQITAVGNFRMKLMPMHYFAVWMFCGHVFVTYGCAFAFSMLVEAPFLALEKIMFRKKISEVKKEMEQNGVTDICTHGELENGVHRTENGQIFQPKLTNNGKVAGFGDREFICRL